MTSLRGACAALLTVLSVTGCAAGPDTATAASRSSSGVTGTVTVFAAASLTEAFTRIARDVERAHPGTRVALAFGASSALAQQVVSGAPADVFAAASPATMRTVTDAGDAADPRVFARNTLQIAVPAEGGGGVDTLADFAREELKIALCAAAVPCGAASAQVFAAAGVTPAPDTLEQDVRAALAKVRLGEVDAALVYRTDVLAAGDEVRGIAFPEAASVVSDYPLAALSQAPNPAGAAAFVAQVLSPQGQRVLADAGFQSP